MQRPKNYDLYRSDSGQIFGNDPFTFSPATIYMAESRYEQVRRDLRQHTWAQWRKSKEVAVSYSKRPAEYRQMLDTIVKYYTRVREAVVAGIEEIWVFLIETVFYPQQQL